MEKINSKYRYSKTIRIWLLIGLIMLIGQVILGGITRLTGSGLSITKWDIITGVIPPLNAEQWVNAFELYKQTPQFHQINETFTINQFKFIYFWEYFHRLWVRSLGIIFLIPFLFFVIKKKIDFFLIKRLGLVVLLTMLTASAGWIMVESGLVDRPWVNAYKLTIHFILAILVISAMVKTVSDGYNLGSSEKNVPKKMIAGLLILTFIQLIFAGLMSGMKAGLYYPSWPDMNGEFIPSIIQKTNNWNWHNFVNYDSFLFAPALIQFTHRMLAYILVVFTIFVFYKMKDKLEESAKIWLYIPTLLVLVQVTLGILTVLNVKGEIPIFLGVTHQLTGLLFYISLLFLWFSVRKVKA